MKILKKFLLFILAISLVLATNGCTKEYDTNEKTKIRFSFWEPGLGNGLEQAVMQVKESYEKIHPETEIEIIIQPVGSYQEWLKTQLAIEDAPEIISNGADLLNDLYVAGYICDIEEEYEKETPYSNGKKWKDTFRDDCITRAHWYSFGNDYAVPMFDAGLAVYYNKDIYKKLNLEVPKTWNEYMSNCEKIEKSGMIPIAMQGQGGERVGWIVRQVTVGLCGQRILSDENINFNGDCITTDNEIVKAIDSGYFDFTTNREYRELYKDCFEMVKEYLSYCANPADYDEVSAKMLFVSGEAAHLYSGSWDLNEIMFSNYSKVDIGIFQFPRITKENGKWAGPGISYNITQPVGINKNISPEKRAAAIDFLQYFTSEKVYKNFIENSCEIPVLKNVEVNPIFDGFITDDGYPENGIFQFKGSRGDINTKQAFLGLIYEPDMELTDDMFVHFQKSMEERAEELKNSFGWNEENDYKISELRIVGGKFKPE